MYARCHPSGPRKGRGSPSGSSPAPSKIGDVGPTDERAGNRTRPPSSPNGLWPATRWCLWPPDKPYTVRSVTRAVGVVPMKLETSRDLLERVRARHNSSWYGLAKLLPASENTVANWRHRRTTIDRKFVTRIAELLEEPPEYVLACVENERTAEPDVRQVWQRIAAKFRSHAASILLVGLAAHAAPSSNLTGISGDLSGTGASVCILWQIGRRKLFPWLKKKNAAPLPLAWTWARIRSTGSVLRSWSLSPVPI
jgi:hypothetical protein